MTDLTSEASIMNLLAKMLDDILNPDPDQEKHIFALIILSPGAIGGSQANWVSNGQRADMLAAMKEMVERFEAADAVKSGKAVLQ